MEEKDSNKAPGAFSSSFHGIDEITKDREAELRVLHTQARLLSKQFLHESAITIALTALADAKPYRHAIRKLIELAPESGHSREEQFTELMDKYLKQFVVYLEAEFLVGSVLDEAQQYRRAQSHFMTVRSGLETLKNVVEDLESSVLGVQRHSEIQLQEFLSKKLPHGVVPTKGTPNFANFAYVTYKCARCHFAVGELEDMFQMLEKIPWGMRTLAVHYDLGKEYERRALTEDACNSYREVLRSNPFATEIIERLLCLGVDINEIEGCFSKSKVPKRYRIFLQSLARGTNAKRQSYYPAACKRLALMVSDNDVEELGATENAPLLQSDVLKPNSIASISAGQWRVFSPPDWISAGRKRSVTHFKDDELLRDSVGLFPEGHEALETMAATWLAEADRYEDAIIAFRRLQQEYSHTANGRDTFALMLYRRSLSLQEMCKLDPQNPPSQTPHMLSKLVENLMDIDRHKLALLSAYETEDVNNEGQRLQIKGSGGGTIARPEPWIAAAAAAITRNEIDSANNLCDIAAAVDPYHVNTLTVTGLALAADERHAAAIGYFTTVFARAPSVTCLQHVIPSCFASNSFAKAQNFVKTGASRFSLDGRMHTLSGDLIMHFLSIRKSSMNPSEISQYALQAYSSYCKGALLSPWWIRPFIGQALSLVESGKEEAIDTAIKALRELRERGDATVSGFPQSREQLNKILGTNSADESDIAGDKKASVSGAGCLSGIDSFADSAFVLGSASRTVDNCPELGQQYAAILSIKIAEILALSSRWSEATQEMNSALSLCPSLPGGKKMLKNIQQQISGNEADEEGEEEEEGSETFDASDRQSADADDSNHQGNEGDTEVVEGGSGATPDQNMDNAMIYSNNSMEGGAASGRRLFHDEMSERSGIIDDSTADATGGMNNRTATNESRTGNSGEDSPDNVFSPAHETSDMEVEFDS